MRLYEYESKKILQAWGIPIPSGSLLASPEEIGEVGEVVLKAQVLTGGRQKAGGVLFAQGPAEARQQARQLFEAEIRGHRVERLLMEAKVEVEREYFLGVTYHTSRKVPLVLFSRQGGVEVEAVAQRGAGGIFQRSFDLLEGFPEYRARELLVEAGLKGEELMKLVGPLQRMVALFLEMDATLAEINPLARTRDGRYLALDCHLEIEEDALSRHPELESR
ncbi:MAG: acetate--CoA ligase family protein [Candidatus Tectomicrobia bacterium]|uniref:Acetate--CoA ligase family protein n=1 Tax=Tectimicrobiota bacterium TaxID=2528274 RepID=A0A932FVP5_UNCTE|nr:acetate--CoA ligase family protein [Candidatus Tectomicrobia bacterium]